MIKMTNKKDISIEDIPGVGEKTAEKLRSVGYTDLMSIAVMPASDLAAIAEIGEGQAQKIISQVREMLDIGFETADRVADKKKTAAKIKTPNVMVG